MCHMAVTFEPPKKNTLTWLHDLLSGKPDIVFSVLVGSRAGGWCMPRVIRTSRCNGSPDLIGCRCWAMMFRRSSIWDGGLKLIYVAG